MEKTPSVNVAYELSVRSVEGVIRRMDTHDANLDRVITWVTAVTTALLTMLATNELLPIPLPNCFYAIGLLCFIGSLAVAFIGKFGGDVIFIDPMKLYNDHLDAEEEEFKLNHVYYLGQHFEKIGNVVENKWRCCVTAIFLFTLELIFLVVGVAVS